MRAETFPSANELYQASIKHLSNQVQTILDQGRDPNLGLPTGNTMIPLYHLIADHAESLQVHRWSCFNLDEYYPIHPQNVLLSFYAYMQTHFYSRLKLEPKRKELLNGQAADPTEECARFESVIKKSGGLDITILGLGTNGHIAFNEPGTEPDTRTHLTELHSDTLLANFSNPPPFRQAMTLGIESILESRHIMVLALGKSKASAVASAIQDPINRNLPASFLQNHPSVQWFLDRESSKFL